MVRPIGIVQLTDTHLCEPPALPPGYRRLEVYPDGRIDTDIVYRSPRSDTLG